MNWLKQPTTVAILSIVWGLALSIILFTAKPSLVVYRGPRAPVEHNYVYRYANGKCYRFLRAPTVAL